MDSRTRFVITLTLLLIFGSNAKAQDIYRTTSGLIQVSGVLNDSTLTAESNELLVLLDYESAQFELRLDKSTLRTGVDSLDKELNKLKGDILVYEGKLDIEYIQTQSHPPQDFVVEGYLTSSPNNEVIIGNGHLVYIFGNLYSCVLTMSFEINLGRLELNLPESVGEVYVEVVQVVLKREGE